MITNINQFRKMFEANTRHLSQKMHDSITTATLFDIEIDGINHDDIEANIHYDFIPEVIASRNEEGRSATVKILDVEYNNKSILDKLSEKQLNQIKQDILDNLYD